MRPNTVYVDGKTLNEIAEESGVAIGTVRHRYVCGSRSYEELAKSSERKSYSNVVGSKRFLDKLWENGITITELERRTGVSRSSIYRFLYNAGDISAMRLAKMCAVVGISMDEVMMGR